MKHFFGIIVLYITLYLLVSFVELSFNPSEWFFVTTFAYILTLFFGGTDAMCYGMGCSKESRATGTCADPWRCAFDQQMKEIIMRKETFEQQIDEIERKLMRKETIQRKTNFYCPNCEDDHKRNYLMHDRGIWRCLECGEVYTTATLREAYEDEYEGLIADAEWIKNSMLDGLDEFTASTTPSRNAA